MTFLPRRLLEVLVEHGVRFVLIGGLAGRLHGSTLITNDVDICYQREPTNLERLATALRALDVQLRGAPADLPFQVDAETLRRGDAFTFTTTAGALDVLGTPAGTSGFTELEANAVVVRLGEIEVAVASVTDLVRMKEAAGRPKDKQAVIELRALLDELEGRQES